MYLVAQIHFPALLFSLESKMIKKKKKKKEEIHLTQNNSHKT
jgi:hypothetical protein